jgi:hypothetical protein
LLGEVLLSVWVGVNFFKLWNVFFVCVGVCFAGGGGANEFLYIRYQNFVVVVVVVVVDIDL